MDEVVAPDVIAIRRPEPNARAVFKPETSLLQLFLRNLQPLSPPQPLDPAVADPPARVPQQSRNAAASRASAPPGQFGHLRHKPVFVFSAAWLMSLR